MNPPPTSIQRQHERTPSPTDPIDRQASAVRKSRKYSTGGGRAWSEDEEIYLLQTRLQKMPYKHIAAHLRKTELACRLHYHQLSNGSGRRKRTVSISSVSSGGRSSMAAEERASPESYASSAPTTPESSTPLEGSPVIRRASIEPDASLVAVSPEQPQKPLLPKPTFAVPQYGPVIRENLRLDCNVAASRLTPIIDKERLREIYEAHRTSFWKMIAADYGEGVSAAALEELWRKGGLQTPFTPGEGADTSVRERHQGPPPSALPSSVMNHSARGFSPINSSVSAPSAQPTRRRSYFTLPTPSTAGTSAGPSFSAGPLAAASIASLLNDCGDARSSTRDVAIIPRIQNADVVMRDCRA